MTGLAGHRGDRRALQPWQDHAASQAVTVFGQDPQPAPDAALRDRLMYAGVQTQAPGRACRSVALVFAPARLIARPVVSRAPR